MKAKVAVVLFPGSNCEHDVVHLYSKLLKQSVRVVWHKEKSLHNPDIVVLPGGFSFGDYLRTGALARLSPILADVKKFAEGGGPVLGICNGFQILCEVGLLPGALLQNVGTKFLSQFVDLKVERNFTPFTRAFTPDQIIRCPIAHGEGNYFADQETIRELEVEGRVVFRYVSPQGERRDADRSTNPNGSINSIAGITNARGNVVGLMPHPERAAEEIVGYVGGKSGMSVFEAVLG